ncbi:MAG: hypothetical protein SGCHY_004437 [Lobulomycetales sp.]
MNSEYSYSAYPYPVYGLEQRAHSPSLEHSSKTKVNSYTTNIAKTASPPPFDGDPMPFSCERCRITKKKCDRNPAGCRNCSQAKKRPGPCVYCGGRRRNTSTVKKASSPYSTTRKGHEYRQSPMVSHTAKSFLESISSETSGYDAAIYGSGLSMISNTSPISVASSIGDHTLLPSTVNTDSGHLLYTSKFGNSNSPESPTSLGGSQTPLSSAWRIGPSLAEVGFSNILPPVTFQSQSLPPRERLSNSATSAAAYTMAALLNGDDLSPSPPQTPDLPS